jgi:predicted component of type VI protein secretion system
MAKLVILNQGLSGHSYDLKVGKTTIGRVEDNSFEISDPSVSSHHCEIHWRGGDAKEVFFRDLGSTNGSFVDDEKVDETVLKLGQRLRLGYVELSFLDEAEAEALAVAQALEAAAIAAAPPSVAAAAAPPPPPPAAPRSPAPTSVAQIAKKAPEGTHVIQRGVSLTELEQGGPKTGSFNNTTVFGKKKKNPNKIFIVIGSIIGVIILVLIIVGFVLVNGSHH